MKKSFHASESSTRWFRVYLEKDELIPVLPNLEDLLSAETDNEDEKALSPARFDDEQ